MIVYFIQAGARGPIKIGLTSDVRRRLFSLQTASPQPLRLLGGIPGGQGLERALHRELAAHHIKGEWFRPAPEVRRFAHLAAVIDGRHPEEVATWQICEELRPRLRRAGLIPKGSRKRPDRGH
jgi:hypothetical protein